MRLVLTSSIVCLLFLFLHTPEWEDLEDSATLTYSFQSMFGPPGKDTVADRESVNNTMGLTLYGYPPT